MIFQFPWCSLLQVAALFITEWCNFHSCWNINGNIQQQIVPLWSLALWKLSCSKLNVKEFNRYEKSDSFYAHTHRATRSSLHPSKHLSICLPLLPQWVINMPPAILPKSSAAGPRGRWSPLILHQSRARCFVFRLLLFPGSELERLILRMVAASLARSLALLKVSLCHLPCHKSETYVLSIDNRSTYRLGQGSASTPALLPANAPVTVVVWEGGCDRQHGFPWNSFCNHHTLISWPCHYCCVVATVC